MNKKSPKRSISFILGKIGKEYNYLIFDSYSCKSQKRVIKIKIHCEEIFSI